MKNGIIMAILLVIWGAIKAFFKLLKVIIQVLSSLIVFLGLYIPLFYILFGVILLAATDFTFGGMGTDQMLYFIGLGLCCIAALIIAIRNLLVRPIAGVFAPFREYREERRRERDERRNRYADRERREEDRDYDRYGDRRDYPDDRGGYFEDRYRRRERGYDEEAPRDPSYADRRGYPFREPYPYRHPEMRGYEEDRERYGEPMPRPNPSRAEAPVYEGQGGYGESDYQSEPERPLIYYSQRRPGVLVKEYSDRFELYQEDREGRHYLGTEYKDE